MANRGAENTGPPYVGSADPNYRGNGQPDYNTAVAAAGGPQLLPPGSPATASDNGAATWPPNSPAVEIRRDMLPGSTPAAGRGQVYTGAGYNNTGVSNTGTGYPGAVADAAGGQGLGYQQQAAGRPPYNRSSKVPSLAISVGTANPIACPAALPVAPHNAISAVTVLGSAQRFWRWQLVSVLELPRRPQQVPRRCARGAAASRSV